MPDPALSCPHSELLTVAISTAGALLGAITGSLAGFLTARWQHRITVASTTSQQWAVTLRETLAEYQAAIGALDAMFEMPERTDAATAQTFERAGHLNFRLNLLLDPNDAMHRELGEVANSAFLLLTTSLRTGDHSAVSEAVRDLTARGQRLLARERSRIGRA
jgi:hypothetical protein